MIFLDRVLRQYATGTKSYIRDTGDFLNKLDNLKLTKQCILVSFDIVSLYTSIEHTRGLQAVKEVLRDSLYPDRVKEFLLELLELTLCCNYFSFQDRFYLQRVPTSRLLMQIYS